MDLDDGSQYFVGGDLGKQRAVVQVPADGRVGRLQAGDDARHCLGTQVHVFNGHHADSTTTR